MDKRHFEFHLHTEFSPDSLLPIRKLIAEMERKNLDVVAITDHNTIAGAVIAAAKYPSKIIVGEEIMTTKGELLAYFLDEEIAPGLSPMDTIERIRRQDGFIAVSHPFDPLRKGAWVKPDLEEIVPYIDAIEVFNSRSIHPYANLWARNFASENKLLGLVGSDAHSAIELGSSRMILPVFNDSDSLKQALRNSTYHTRWSGYLVHLLSRYAHLRKRL